MGRLGWRSALLVLSGLVLGVAVAWAIWLVSDPGLHASGTDPREVASTYARSMVRLHNATRPWNRWELVRVEETSGALGADAFPGYVEREFDVKVVRIAAGVPGKPRSVSTVGVIRPATGGLWRYKWHD